MPLVVQYAAGDSDAATAAKAIAEQLRDKGYRVEALPQLPAGPPPKPRYFDRKGRELPLNAEGVPQCPGCGEWDRVTVGKLGPQCGRCGGMLDRLEPRRHLPDF